MNFFLSLLNSKLHDKMKLLVHRSFYIGHQQSKKDLDFESHHKVDSEAHLPSTLQNQPQL